MSQPAPPVFRDDADKVAYVRREVNAASDALRARFPLLDQQSLVGATVMAVSVAAMLAIAWLYARGAIAWYVAVPAVAFVTSLIHELEHDLIHLMYFKKTPWAHHLMMALCWLARPGTINPWTRRRMHLHHHKVSGGESDLEEFGITNGEPWGIKRLLMLADGMLAVVLRPQAMRRKVRRYVAAQPVRDAAERAQLRVEQVSSYMPLGHLYYALWHAFIVYHAGSFVLHAFGYAASVPVVIARAMHVVDFVAVVWLAPNFVRSFCINFVSSNMHYFGDIDPRNVIQQTQVLNPWWMLPFQLFCFNFGSTHAIHHFVVRDPFYIRQLTARTAHAALRDVGVRFNDVATFKRANRWGARRGPAGGAPRVQQDA
ncbi:fatty acid desaturase [Burkholderia vietnamiensis]|uniref:fatty acid desaturase n=1 Tax=Burkholderia vietnamiensis TaxID=60552 RepID=UPI00075EBBDC|nr:fatty acid desaturase [Burkholderia vietnamiensis]KVR90087.1 fatty acid desaturase [Burkholderia vietnamiensis]MCA8073723.1 fatty acid desaturase [Burkholderia vietnamiensis]MCA8231321.1 fatty acid desaturase [Burkholderia vietnamiensis]MCA8451062.1 fatty acid desaturase [Burkholderia vietnamiensis]UEC02078.1 fatty acid desaturase [Burkholderia vietnamiensis]